MKVRLVSIRTYWLWGPFIGKNHDFMRIWVNFRGPKKLANSSFPRAGTVLGGGIMSASQSGAAPGLTEMCRPPVAGEKYKDRDS